MKRYRKITWGFTQRLVLGMLIISTLGLGAMYMVITTLVRDTIYDSVVGVAQRDMIISGERIDNWFVSAGLTVDSLATVLSTLNSQYYFESIALNYVAQHEFIENVFIGFSDGSVINGIGWTPPAGWYSHERPWYIAAVEAGAGNVGATVPYVSHSTGNITVGIGTYLPHLCDVGAVVGLSLSLDFVMDKIAEHPIMVDDGYLILIGANGEIIYHPNPAYVPNLADDTSGTLFNIREIPNGETILDLAKSGLDFVEFDDVRLGSSYMIAMPIGVVDWTLITVIPSDATGIPLRQYLTTIVASLTGVLVALFAFTIIFVSTLVKHMEKGRLTEEKLQAIIDSVPVLIEIWDEDCNVVDCNKQTLDIFGLSSVDEFIKRYNEFNPELQPCGKASDELNRYYADMTLKHGQIQHEWIHLLPTGEPLPTNITCVRTELDGKTMILGYTLDMRDAKRREQAEEESRAKTRFLARMSHEIRTPMNAVLGIAEIQLQRDDISKETEIAFTRIHNSSTLLLSIINDILDLSKVEAGKMEIVAEEYDVASMIVDTVQLNVIHLGSKAIEFSLKVDENIPAHLIGDEFRIKQIMNNILSNAFKYTHQGSVSLVFGKEKIIGDATTLIITISDTGQGMTKEQTQEVFEIEFTRLNKEINRGVEGSGLGMRIAKNLVDMMDGSIEVVSEPDKGSTFIIRIPQKVNNDIVLGYKSVKKLQNLDALKNSLRKVDKIKRELMPYGKVLVVDDVESNLYVMKGLLRQYKLAVDTADSGMEAIDKVASGATYDIIFMDHMMPEVDGLEAAKIIRGMGYNKPIVALTANTVGGIKEMFLNSDFQDFIAKPVDVEHLDDILMEYVRRR